MKVELLKPVCIQAIQNKTNRVEIKYPKVFEDVEVTQIGSVQGFRITSEPLFDTYQFDAYELLRYIEGVEKGSTDAEAGRLDSGAVPDDSTN